MNIEYIPITESTSEGKIILKGYIKEVTIDQRRIFDKPLVFDNYQGMIKYVHDLGSSTSGQERYLSEGDKLNLSLEPKEYDWAIVWNIGDCE